MSETEGDPVIAFVIVLFAGLSTGLGASVVFFPRLVNLASRRVLAGSLGLSAGVMAYVSLVEIFQKSILSFEDAGYDNLAYSYGTLCFFGGIVLMFILDQLVNLFAGYNDHKHDLPEGEDAEADTFPAIVNAVPHCIGCVDDPIAELENWQKLANDPKVHADRYGALNRNKGDDADNSSVNSHDRRVEEICNRKFRSERPPGDIVENDVPKDNLEPSTFNDVNPDEDEKQKANENKQLEKMGLTTALAIGLHNFPEGLATFIAALDDPKVGAVLAIAIGIHNIPEGLCVSLPVYYATGSRMKGFLWALLSGLSEPIAALLGWAVLAKHFNNETFAILFGIVSGMMVMITIKELLPTAHRYDPIDSVVTNSFVFGMAVMALSLVLFSL